MLQMSSLYGSFSALLDGSWWIVLGINAEWEVARYRVASVEWKSELAFVHMNVWMSVILRNTYILQPMCAPQYSAPIACMHVQIYI